MSYMHEMMRFHSNLGVKMYIKLDGFLVGYTLHYHLFGGPEPHYIHKYFLPRQISKMTLKISKTSKFRASLTCLILTSSKSVFSILNF